MSDTLTLLGAATLTFAVGMWLMLPRGAAIGRSLGTVLVAVSLGLFAACVPWLGAWAGQSVFYILAAVTVLAAVGTVTFRSPVYSAIWFALSLLGTAGLFLFQGAQFLGVATVVVYAGAILVTFLFVLMLAQPSGHAFYDRLSWGAPLSALTGAVVVGVLTLTIVSAFQIPAEPDDASAGSIVQRPALHTADELDGEILAEEHMAHLGAQLFSNYLVAIEVAGTLLLVALVGTVAIVAQIRNPAAGGRAHG
jgi:NADH-quinone oxidoreductase subunit J